MEILANILVSVGLILLLTGVVIFLFLMFKLIRLKVKSNGIKAAFKKWPKLTSRSLILISIGLVLILVSVQLIDSVEDENAIGDKKEVTKHKEIKDLEIESEEIEDKEIKNEEIESEKIKDEEIKDENPIDEEFNIDKNENDIEAEKNAEKHPAKSAAILVTKGDYNFTGMKYFFKGQFVKYEYAKNIFDELQEVLLIRNEHGYVMPIFPLYDINLQEGDEVSIWGTLTGNGYVIDNIDNVVGQTGAIEAYRITVNGVMQ